MHSNEGKEIQTRNLAYSVVCRNWDLGTLEQQVKWIKHYSNFKIMYGFYAVASKYLQIQSAITYPTILQLLKN